MDQIISAAFSQLLGAAINQSVQQFEKDPQGFIQTIADIFLHRHSVTDVIQDVWDAVAAGHLSPTVATQVTKILATELERQQQRPAAPQTELDCVQLARQFDAWARR